MIRTIDLRVEELCSAVSLDSGPLSISRCAALLPWHLAREVRTADQRHVAVGIGFASLAHGRWFALTACGRRAGPTAAELCGRLNAADARRRAGRTWGAGSVVALSPIGTGRPGRLIDAIPLQALLADVVLAGAATGQGTRLAIDALLALRAGCRTLTLHHRARTDGVAMLLVGLQGGFGNSDRLPVLADRNLSFLLAPAFTVAPLLGFHIILGAQPHRDQRRRHQ